VRLQDFSFLRMGQHTLSGTKARNIVMKSRNIGIDIFMAA
jgi:hypothetical protein